MRERSVSSDLPKSISPIINHDSQIYKPTDFPFMDSLKSSTNHKFGPASASNQVCHEGALLFTTGQN